MFLNYFKIFLLTLIIVANLGCQKKYHKNITLERDGEVYSINFDDINDSIKNGLSVKHAFNSLCDEFTYEKVTNVVNNEIYNFLVVIPIKTKSNLKEILSYTDYIIYIPNYGGFLSYDRAYKDLDGYYHYGIYKSSNGMASLYMLNDIKDIKLYLQYIKSDFDDDIKITSNKLTIPKEEFEHMLEKLAISHERLDFQPEGY